MGDFDRFDGSSEEQKKEGETPDWRTDEPGQEYQASDNLGLADEFAENQTPYSQNQHIFYAADPSPQKSSRMKVLVIVLCMVVLCVVLVFTAYALFQQNSKKLDKNEVIVSRPSASLTVNSAPDETEKSEDLPDGELTSEQIAEKVMPSVVGVVVYTAESAKVNMAYSEGSGIIMTGDGYVITNAHVVLQEVKDPNTGQTAYKPVDKIEIYLNNEEYTQATLVGVDIRTDLAVVKIDKAGLIAAEFGDSKALKIGEKAIAIGNPTGRLLSSSFTQGVISGVDRSINIGMSGHTLDCIQTDAAINPGNSGGALVNKFGQVIGINSSKIAATDYEGIGFAIPIHEAKPIIDDLIENGFITDRVRIGITFTTITEALAELRGTPAGLRVVQVDETTDAFAKGIRPGDIIVQLDGAAVYTLPEISDILDEKQPGDTVTLSVYRVENGVEDTFDVDVELQLDTSTSLIE